MPTAVDTVAAGSIAAAVAAVAAAEAVDRQRPAGLVQRIGEKVTFGKIQTTLAMHRAKKTRLVGGGGAAHSSYSSTPLSSCCKPVEGVEAVADHTFQEEDPLRIEKLQTYCLRRIEPVPAPFEEVERGRPSG